MPTLHGACLQTINMSALAQCAGTPMHGACGVCDTPCAPSHTCSLHSCRRASRFVAVRMEHVAYNRYDLKDNVALLVHLAPRVRSIYGEGRGVLLGCCAQGVWVDRVCVRLRSVQGVERAAWIHRSRRDQRALLGCQQPSYPQHPWLPTGQLTYYGRNPLPYPCGCPGLLPTFCFHGPRASNLALLATLGLRTHARLTAAPSVRGARAVLSRLTPSRMQSKHSHLLGPGHFVCECGGVCMFRTSPRLGHSGLGSSGMGCL